MRRTLRERLWAALLAGAACVAQAEVSGPLTQELAGTELTYHYDGGRRYQVRFAADTISWLRLDVPGRSWESGTPYIARKIADDLYYVNWHRPERVEYITILFDFNRRLMYTSALLEGRERHFETARIVELSRPPSGDIAGIDAATARWISAFNAKSVADIVALYAPDAVFFGTSSPVLRDSPALVLDYFKSLPSQGTATIALGEHRVQVFGDVAISTGYYTRTATENGREASNPARFTFVYAKRDGHWVIVNHHSSVLP